MNIISFKNNNIYKNLYPTDINGREINIYKFNNCTFSGINLYYPNVLLKSSDSTYNLYLPLLERTMSLNMTTIYENYDMKYNWNNKNSINTVDNPVFFFVYNTENYYHFIYDTLPYLISYFELKKNIKQLKLLIQYPNSQKKELYNFVIDFYKLLQLDNDLIYIDNSTTYNEVYISTSYTHDIDSNLPPRNEIYDFYKMMVNSVRNKYVKNTPKKIYISRRTWIHNDYSNIGTNYTTKRKLKNEDELVEYLCKKGYTEVFTENMSTIDKILLFSNASHVIGAIGGGIANVLFSNENTELIALVSPTFLDINKRFIYSLNKVRMTIFDDTCHYESDKYKKYMRVKYNNIIGEIDEINGDNLIISYTDGSNTGWNNQYKYDNITINKNDVILLDNGLNSEWIVNNIENII
jgi:hypothetical protein